MLTPKIATDSLCNSRLLLSSFGWLSSAFPDMKLIENNSNNFKRHVKTGLDKIPGYHSSGYIDLNLYSRHCIKLGLIYVKYSQQDELDIFHNDLQSTSLAYRDFVQGLAPVVCQKKPLECQTSHVQ